MLSRQAPPGGVFSGPVVFLILAGACVLGSILQHRQLNYGVNDGSRWNTVYYLVEHGTFEYLPDHGAEHFARYGASRGPHSERPSNRPPFYTIDMIGMRDADGWHYFSSKPPFIPTYLAGVVLLIEQASFGTLDFVEQPFLFIRTTLVLTQLIPLLVCLWLIWSHQRDSERSPWLACFCLAAITLGTYLTPWAVTLNNHVIAGCTAMFALHAAIRILYDGRRGWGWFAAAGFFAAFTACCELPAGLFAVILFVALLVKDRYRTLAIGLPAAAVPTFVALLTNYLVVGSVLPAYADINEAGGVYDFPGSYWTAPQGIDALEDSKGVYLFNMLLGHHGFFILNPVLLLCLAGLLARLLRADAPRRGLAWLTWVLTATVVAVYLFTTNNYGGGTKGFRWLFWLIPFWLLFLSDGVAYLAPRRSGRVLCYLALAVSVVSVADALQQPWGYSWLERFHRTMEWFPS
jgi:hypothetical protein